MGRIIAIVNQKGGCGKSTTAVHLVEWLRRRNDATALLVDADAQETSSKWLKRMEQSDGMQVTRMADELLDNLPRWADEHDLVVVDGPAGLAETTRAILMRCDLAVVPCQPSGADVDSTADTVRLIKQAQSVRGGPPDAAIFISRAVKRTNLKAETIEVLDNITDVELLGTVIHQRQVIADSYGQMATVWDLTGTPAAQVRAEFDSLFQDIRGRMQ